MVEAAAQCNLTSVC